MKLFQGKCDFYSVTVFPKKQIIIDVQLGFTYASERNFHGFLAHNCRKVYGLFVIKKGFMKYKESSTKISIM